MAAGGGVCCASHHSLLFLQQLTIEYLNFTLSNNLLERITTTFISKNLNSRVVKFCIVLMSVTNLHDYFGLYSLTGSMSVSIAMSMLNMFTLTAI